MLTIKNLGLIASAVLVASPLVNADTYSLSGGLTRVYSSTFNTEVGISPNPTGIASGSLEVDVDQSTGTVTMGNGDHFVLSDFTGRVEAFGTVTTFDAVATDVTVNNPVTSTLNSSRQFSATSSDMQPSVDVVTDFQNCSGLACLAISNVVLDLKNYTVNITFDETFSTFQGTMQGVTNNGSIVEMDLVGVRSTGM